MLQQILFRSSDSGATGAPESKPEQSPQARYTAAIQGLLNEAYEQKSILQLVDVLTWALAIIAADFGSLGIADILGRLGGHLRWINENRTAQAEGESARRNGTKPH